MKIFTPFVIATNIYDVDLSFYDKYGIKFILCDLDNTLDAYYQKTPTKQAKDFVKKLKEHGIELIVVSNNNDKRVSLYANELGARYISRSGKPFACKTKKFLKENEIDKNLCIAIGDQVFTDVVYANKLKIKSILCDNLVSKDQFVTRINKFFDKYFRKVLKKRNKLINWKEK